MAFQSFKLFALELDGPDNTVYSSGEMITGVVVLELNREIKVRAMRVLGRGVATAHWLENRSVGVNTVYNDYTSKTTYFRKRRHLIRDNGELTVLPAGRHEYPFSFQLPEETLVTSFEGKHGSIRYWVKVKLHRPWATVKKIKKEFTVIEPIDINTPSLLASQAGTKEKMARIWYRNCGQVSITAKIDRKGYTPGEVIPVFAEFDNSTSRSVMPKAFITQTQTFIARGTMKQKRAVVATLCGDIVGANRRETWHGRAIKIPPVGPSILQCRIIKVEYMLRVCVDVPGTSKLSLELPLVMGTIPLHPFGSRTSSVSSQYSVNMEWLRMAIPEQPEPPPDYSSVVTDEEAVQNSTAGQPEEDLSGVLQRSLMAYVQEFRLRPPPVYSEVDPNPQPINMRPPVRICASCSGPREEEMSGLGKAERFHQTKRTFSTGANKGSARVCVPKSDQTPFCAFNDSLPVALRGFLTWRHDVQGCASGCETLVDFTQADQFAVKQGTSWKPRKLKGADQESTITAVLHVATCSSSVPGSCPGVRQSCEAMVRLACPHLQLTENFWLLKAANQNKATPSPLTAGPEQTKVTQSVGRAAKQDGPAPREVSNNPL
ncbi:unnamed protein product [Leuciscus chuanchicus]